MEGGKHGQRKGKRIDIVKLYKIRGSIESLKLGGGHINPKIHIRENKILVSTLSAYFDFIFTYTLKKFFFLKSYQFLYKFVCFFFQPKHEKHDSSDRSLKGIPSLLSFLCPQPKQTKTEGVRGKAAAGVGQIPCLDHSKLVPRSLRQSQVLFCRYF